MLTTYNILTTLFYVRSTFIRESWNKVNNCHTSSFSAVVANIVTIYVANNIVKEDLHKSVHQKLLKEVTAYFTTGSCRHQKETAFVCVNPTMLDPTTHLWCVHHTLSPFDSFLPLSREELNLSENGSVVRSCQKILKSLTAAYRRRMETVNIFFHLEDALEFCLNDNNEKCDVIDSSNLADHVGLANLISVCSKRLIDNSESLLFTESLTWKTLAPSVLQYVEEALFSPLSMIPTIYGLRLADHVELGESTPVNLGRMLVPSANLVWQKAPTYQHIVLCPSPVLDRCLNRLASKCFTLPQQKGKSEERCGMMCYSPLTFNYVMDSITQRVGGNKWLKNAQQQANIPLVFNLSQKTTNAWKNGRTVLKLSAEIEFKTPAEKIFLTTFNRIRSTLGAPALRLVLAPHSTPQNLLTGFSSLLSGLCGPDTHFVDNLHLQMKKTKKDEIERVTYSFLLSPDHGLGETHFGIIVDMATETPIIFIESLRTLRTEKFSLPYPFLFKGPSPNDASEEIGEMKVDSCVEFEEQYVIKIMIKCETTISGNCTNI